jgi:SPX domain protein involved in polyphosphate accumulation
MKFIEVFEQHKIPDWYTEYLNYDRLAKRIKEFKKAVIDKESQKIQGFYLL